MPRTSGLSKSRLYAYDALGVDPLVVAQQPQITPQLRQMYASIKRASGTTLDSIPSAFAQNVPADPIYYLRASDAPEARAVMVAYNSLSKCNRSKLPIEAFCVAANVSPLRILEIIVGVAVRLGAQASTILAAVNHPRVVERTIDDAINGADEIRIPAQTLLHKATGFLPTPKGAQTTIQVNTSAQANATAQAAAAAVDAPPPEGTIRRLIDRFHKASALTGNTPAQLPQSTQAESVPTIMPESERELEPLGTITHAMPAEDEYDPEEEEDDAE